MNLLLWRHAEAEDSQPDLERVLTPRGRKQAERVAGWLRGHLPDHYALFVSPAQRTIQTAEALAGDYVIDRRLAPGAAVAQYLAVVGWPVGPAESAGNVVVVGHQPALGNLASRLLAGSELGWSVKKGAVWWLTTRERDGGGEVTLRAVISPDLL